MAVTPTFEPTRTQFIGIRASDPSVVGLVSGQWWYNTTEDRFKYFNGSSIIAFEKEPSEGTHTLVVPSAGNYKLSITISGVSTITYLLNLRVNTEPVVDPGTPTCIHIAGNVVGLTLIGVGGGTTLTGTATVLGY